MSLFFEDVEIKRSSSEVVVEDVTGLINVTLESEMAWHNITTEIMKEEFSAVLNEDEEQAEGAKTSLFKKILEFFKNVWTKFVQVVNSLVTRLQTQFGAAIKYAKPLNAKLSKYEGGAQASIHEWKIQDIGKIVDNFSAEGLGSKLSTAISNSANEQRALTAEDLVKLLGYESFADMDKKIVEKARSNETKGKEITKQDGAVAYGNIMNASKTISALKKMSGSMKKVVDAGRKEAMEGLNTKDAETKKKKVASTSTARVATSVINKVLNVMIKLVMECFSDSVKVIKAVSARVGGSDVKKGEKEAHKTEKANAKADAKAKKQAEKEAKNESIFDLTLEDFEDEVLEEDTDVEELEELNEDFDLDLELEAELSKF
jgi:uncharacterized protein YidB (DUF937 family)